MSTTTDSHDPTRTWPGDRTTPDPAWFSPRSEPWAPTVDYYPTQPVGYPPRPVPRIRSTGTRIAISLLIGFALLGIAGTVLAIVDASRSHPAVSGASTNGGAGAAINTANPGTAGSAPQTTGATWSGDLTAFSSVIGTGPATGDAWNEAPCTATTLGATGEQATALCGEPDGTRVFVTDFTSPSDVTELMQSEVAAGGTATGWTFNGQHLGNMVTSDTNNTPTVAISFANDPDILVTMMNTSTQTLASDVNSAPLPH